jgi:hypothetical protein
MPDLPGFHSLDNAIFILEHIQQIIQKHFQSLLTLLSICDVLLEVVVT